MRINSEIHYTWSKEAARLLGGYHQCDNSVIVSGSAGNDLYLLPTEDGVILKYRDRREHVKYWADALTTAADWLRS